jgi:hypothetical protein
VLGPDSVRSIFGLFIHLRVEVRVKDDNSVCNLQVESVTSSPGRQQEDEVVSEFVLELHDILMALLLLHASIKLAVLDATIFEKEAKQV